MPRLRCATILFQGREVEIVVGTRAAVFEFWLVTSVRGVRTVCTHYLTGDDLESQLLYAEHRPLQWKDYSFQDLPTARTRHVIQWEKSVRPDKITSFEKLSYHFVALPPWEQEALKVARQRIAGAWASSGVTLTLSPGGEVASSNSLAELGSPTLRLAALHNPDVWCFDGAGLHLQNSETKAGSWIRVLHVDDVELHLLSLTSDRLADVLLRH